MAINRKELVSLHNPVLTKSDYSSPLTVGNGEFAFTADITGLQTLYKEYEDTLPLCTMSQWGWHTIPVSKDQYSYTLNDVVMTEYDYQGRKVIYPKKKMPGNEEVYDWLRKNPHRLNLARIAFYYNGNEISEQDITPIKQELFLYEGKLVSEFLIDGTHCIVKTCCDSKSDTVAFKVQSKALKSNELTVCIRFPYGSSTITASDWESDELHHTEIIGEETGRLLCKRTLDKDVYFTSINADKSTRFTVDGHKIMLHFNEENCFFTVGFSKDLLEQKREEDIFVNSENYWHNFWETGGILRLNKSKDTRALELERRIIQSQYLMAVNSMGSAPPQETGLTCNSWYGKMHLEMYFWHCAWAPLWNHGDLLERSIPWFVEHLPEARENAARNGYRGCRWPKMIALEGIDCPSAVAPLLVWQQPHIIFMLELLRGQKDNTQVHEFMESYWILVKETADFMCDFVAFNEVTGKYDIVSPVIPVQECHRPEVTKNPAFEVEYFRVTLHQAIDWAQTLGIKVSKEWEDVANNMAEPAIENGLYLAHENCPDTFEMYNRDHPSMLGVYGILPKDDVNREAMKATLKKVIECWKYESLWGWDFAVMAMTAVRLGDPETAIDLLLLDSPKNNYVVSGNNRQILRKDLPLYLPGNGSLLLAIPLMAVGYEGCSVPSPGFPKDGNWVVEAENIAQYV